MSDQSSPFTARAYAKLNLALAVGAPIDAPGSVHHGYHPICSYMHAIDLFDTIEIERLGNGEPSRFDIAWAQPGGGTTPVGWEIEQDLVYRSHLALEQHLGRKLPCGIRVRKSIPAGGGLGGGSSDAARVLMGLDGVFGLGLGATRLREIAMTLGSDIAFFIDENATDGITPPRPAVVSGFGGRIERAQPCHSGTRVTLILPPFGCSTGAVYRRFDGVCDREQPDEGPARALAEATSLTDDGIFNDLCRAARLESQRLSELIDGIAERLGRRVHMTGSGSTLFVLGLVSERVIHEVAPDCRVVRTRLV